MPSPNTQTPETDELSLKWGTLKAWHFRSDAARAAAKAYAEAGPMSASAMAQHDTPEQKAALCNLIDVLNCDTVTNDWSGERMTKEEAKRYVMEYGQ